MRHDFTGLPTVRIVGRDIWHFTNLTRTRTACGLDLSSKSLEPDTVEATFGYGQPEFQPQRCALLRHRNGGSGATMTTILPAEAEAIVNWIEISHANFPEHDHHCQAGRWVQQDRPSGLRILAGPNKGRLLTRTVQVESGKLCTCGYTEAQAALADIRERV